MLQTLPVVLLFTAFLFFLFSFLPTLARSTTKVGALHIPVSPTTVSAFPRAQH